MKHVVAVADMKISAARDDVIVTHGLGSCLGIVAYDAAASVGGMLHVMLPQAQVNLAKAQDNPFMFVDTGVPEFFRRLYASGAAKNRLAVKVAGGAAHNIGDDHFAIGKRNYLMLKKMFWKNNVLIDAEEVGGSIARTLYLEIGSGRVWLSAQGEERDL